MIDTLFNHCQSRRHHKERCDDDVVVVVVVVCYRMRPARKIVFRSVVVDVLTHTHTQTREPSWFQIGSWFDSLSHTAQCSAACLMPFLSFKEFHCVCFHERCGSASAAAAAAVAVVVVVSVPY